MMREVMDEFHPDASGSNKNIVGFSLGETNGDDKSNQSLIMFSSDEEDDTDQINDQNSNVPPSRGKYLSQNSNSFL